MHDDHGRETYRPTAEGIVVGRMLAMAECEDADKVLEGLLRWSADHLRLAHTIGR